MMQSNEPKPQTAAERNELTAIIEEYGLVDWHVQAIHDEIDRLSGSNEHDTAERIEKLNIVLTHCVEVASKKNYALNDPQIEKSVDDVLLLETPTEFNSFPMSWFLEYVEPTPKYNVGDIVWAQFANTEDGKVMSIRAIVVGKGVDLDEVYYTLAPYTDRLDVCVPIARDFDEHELSLDDPDPKKKFTVVK